MGYAPASRLCRLSPVIVFFEPEIGMKRKWQHPENLEGSHDSVEKSRRARRAPEAFSEWLEREFPRGAAEFNGGENSRRDFVKLMGASTALAGFGVACSRPVRHLVPFNEHVEWVDSGESAFLFVRPSPAQRNWLRSACGDHF